MRGEHFHFCEKYMCTMSFAACVKRHKIATDLRNPNSTQIRDAGCLKCDLDKIKQRLDTDGAKMITEPQKKCCRCHELKGFDQFCKNKSNADNLDYICKQCKYEDARKRRERIRMEKTNVESEATTDVIPNAIEAHELDEKETSPINMRVEVDFSEYPELYDYFIKTCKEEFRSQNMMILYMIRYFQKQ